MKGAVDPMQHQASQDRSKPQQPRSQHYAKSASSLVFASEADPRH
jgi:hypothetical protein